MNDFTKAELEDIAQMMRHARKQCIETTHDLTYEIERKVLKMISNYCETQCNHASDGNTALLSHPIQYKCIKCGAFYK